jgi:hypothetical protein
MADPPEGRGSDRTGYALVKYGIILIIVIVILYFVVAYILPDGNEAADGDEDGVTVPTQPDEGGESGDEALPSATTS